MSFIRYYRRNPDGPMDFREAWYEDEVGQLVVNHGHVGHQSKTTGNDDVGPEDADRMLAAFEQQCTADGYEVIPETEQSRVVAQFALKSTDGTERDRYLERKAVATITGHFAWRGLGTVEGSEFRPGRLNINCLSPDPQKAVNALKICLREAALDFTKLRIGVAPYDESTGYRLRHPLPVKSPFVL
ncbi:hypothetical protein [Arthrobacter roseus]|uniref:hypothetical protein n=1 Tax=Arthrobacter roseus TaxID=136274 RepID=UPI00196236BA|nr:hypothetical protein [Arthrobacter roseus]MBM7848394.1 hypothetical protein [Arthrobacter roseus]